MSGDVIPLISFGHIVGILFTLVIVAEIKTLTLTPEQALVFAIAWPLFLSWWILFKFPKELWTVTRKFFEVIR